jgi:cellulose synthase/poly-beta-1,6-N-acetylglucosamine synthase-like glycosyltransferase
MSFLHLIAALIGFVLLLATLPLVLELFVLSVASALPSHDSEIDALSPLRLAVVIPAHNEQQLIAACIRSLAGATAIYVVAHNCTDETAARAEAAGAKVLVLNDHIGGKGVALDHGFRNALTAGADVVLVIDADSIAAPNLIAAVSAAFAAGAEALQCRYEVANPDANRRVRLASLAFLGMNVLRPLGRHRLGLSCGIFGNGFALSAATLARVPYTPNSLVEDVEYHLHLIRAGVRVRFLNHAAVFGEMPDSTTAASSQRARWEGGRILMRREWSRPLALEVLRGRVRMIEPLLDLLAFPLTTEAALLAVAFVGGLAASLLWLTLYGFAGLCILLLYVLLAATHARNPWSMLRALVSAPAYLTWKLLMIPRTRLASRKDAAWVRTKRNEDRDQGSGNGDQ